MKADQMAQYVHERQKDIAKDVSEIIARHINDISAKTGLDIHELTVRLLDVTSCNCESRMYAVAGVDIGYSMPAPVETV